MLAIYLGRMLAKACSSKRASTYFEVQSAGLCPRSWRVRSCVKDRYLQIIEITEKSLGAVTYAESSSHVILFAAQPRLVEHISLKCASCSESIQGSYLPAPRGAFSSQIRSSCDCMLDLGLHHAERNTIGARRMQEILPSPIAHNVVVHVVM